MFGQQKSEIALIRACQQGDVRSFEIIVERYQSLLCAITYSGTGSFEHSEELAQEIFLLAWKNIKDLRDPSKFHGWLCTIARNTVQNWRRHRARRREGQVAPLTAASEHPARAADPAEAVIQQEQEAVINRALEQIPEHYREPLILFYRENKSARDVAQLLGISENTTRQRLSRARSMLKEQVHDMVEHSLSRSRPGKAFTTAVVSSLAVGALKTATTSAGISTFMTTVLSSVTAKVIIAAAAITLVVGLGWGLKQRASQSLQPEASHMPQVASSTATPATEPNRAFAEPTQQTESPAPAPPLAPESKEIQTTETAATTTSSPQSQPIPVLQGRMTDIDTGEPITQAEIRISPAHGGRVYETVTDVNGIYRFEKVNQEGAYNIRPRPDDYITPDEWERPRQTVELRTGHTLTKDFALERGCRVELRAIDENKQPIKKVNFFAAYIKDEVGRGPKQPVRTDENGLAFIGGLRPAEYLVMAAHPDYALAGQKILLTEPQEIQSIDFEMKAGIAVTGITLCSDGLPASGWEIRPVPIWWHSVYSWPYDDPAAEDGSFTFTHIQPGLHRIEVYIPEEDGGSRGIWSTDVTLPPTTELLELNIPQPSPHSRVNISGTVKYIGDPLERGFWIGAQSKAGCYSSVYWNGKDETLTIPDLVPGLYDISYWLEGERVVIKNIEAPKDDFNIEIGTGQVFVLNGYVVDKQTGEAITDFRVGDRQISDPNGYFEITTRKPEGIYVTVSAEGYGDTRSPKMSPDNSNSVIVEMQHPRFIKGRIIDETGNPIAGVTIAPRYTDTGFPETAPSDETGQFTLDINPTHRSQTWMAFKHPNYARVYQQIDCQNPTSSDLTIVMTPGAQVSGRLYDWQGQPLGLTPLLFMDEPDYSYWKEDRGRLAQVTTDVNGFYHVDHLPEELCYVLRENPDRQLGTVVDAVLPSRQQPRSFNIGGTWCTRGRLIHQGQPLTNMRIKASFGSYYQQGFTAYTLTDAQGRFSFYGLPTGQRSLYVNVSGRQQWLKFNTYDFIRGQDRDQGDIDVTLAEVVVELTQAENNTPGQDWDINIQTYSPDRFWGRDIGESAARNSHQDPFVFYNLPAGTFQVQAKRQGYPTIYQCFDIHPQQKSQGLTLNIPNGTASLQGQVLFSNDKWSYAALTLRSIDQCLYYSFTVDANESYRLDHLPAGDFILGCTNVGKSRHSHLQDIHLRPGEQKTLDIQFNPGDSGHQGNGSLRILVVDDQGHPLATPNAWLEQNNSIVEPIFNIDDGKTFIAMEGTARLHIEYPGFETCQEIVEIKPREKTKRLPQVIVLKKND